MLSEIWCFLLIIFFLFSFLLSFFALLFLLVLYAIIFGAVLLCLLIWCPDISVNMVDKLGVADPGICTRFSVGLEILPLSMVT